MSEKSLLDQWRGMAYDQTLSKDQLEKFWANYFLIEKGIYEKLLADPDTVVKGTVKELAEKYGQDVMTMVGFLDGIQSSAACYSEPDRDDDRRYRGKPGL